MAERMRSLAKRSGSKMSISKSSMNHMGTVPFKYKVDVFISYVDVVKTAGEVCVTWERRGKSNATASVKVKDKKAVFKEALTMETTLFRKPPPKGAENEEYKFDEKIAKFALRKGNADGKALGKMHINLADHIKGPTGTVFADLKLSNGSIIVTKIESVLLHSGKKAKKAGSGASEACSEMTDMDGGMEDDSIFGDDAPDDLGDLDLMIEESGGDASNSPKAPVSQKTPKAAAKEESKASASKSPKQVSRQESVAENAETSTPKSSKKEKPKTKAEKAEKGDAGLAQSPSIRDKLKSKMKKEKGPSSKKEKSGDDSSSSKGGEAAAGKESSSRMSAELAQLREAVTSLTAENRKLRTSKQAMMEEIEELRSELESSEQALGELQESGVASSSLNGEDKLRREKKELQAKVKELEGQVEGLLDELDGSEEQGGRERKQKPFDGEDYKRQIVDLELALKREPQYLDVVDELKVAKMSLALANMEREQAVFALRRYEGGKDAPGSPLSQGHETPRRNESGWGLGLFG